MDIIQHNMTVQEVFNTPAIKEIEQQILAQPTNPVGRVYGC